MDGAEVREALWARVDDEDAEVREQGICGLARRRDRRVLPLVADLLAGGDVHLWLFDAAAWLGDDSLVPLLLPYDIGEVEHHSRSATPVYHTASVPAAARDVSMKLAASGFGAKRSR